MILETDVVLIAVLGEQVDEHRHQQQPIGRLASRERQKAQRQEQLQGVQNLTPAAIVGAEQLGQQIAGVDQRRLDSARQTVLLIENEIIKPIDHRAVDEGLGVAVAYTWA